MKKILLLLAFPLGLYLILWTSYTFFLDIPFDAKRLVEGILLITGAGIVCIFTYFQEKWFNILSEVKNRNRLIIKALAALFLMGLFSAALSNYPQYAFLEVGHLFLLFNLLILCIVGYLYKPSYFEYGFLSVIGLMAGLYLINVAISYSYSFFIPSFPLWPSNDFLRIWYNDIGFRYPEPFLNFIHVRFFNHIQTWTLPLITLLVLKIPQKHWAFSKIAFIIACGWWMLVFAADARGTMVASLTTLGFIFIIYRKKAQQWLRTHSLAAAIGLGLYLVFFMFLPSEGQPGGRTILTRFTDNGRFELWEYALQLVLQNPLFGAGPMHYAAFNDVVNYSAPHNAYIQIFSEWGIPAGVLFLAIVTLGSYKWFIRSNQVIQTSTANSDKVNIRVALTASLLATLIHALVTNNLNTPMSQIMMVLVLAWMIGLSLSNKKEQEKRLVKPYARYGLIAANLLAAGFLIWSYSMQVPNLDESRRQYLIKTQGNKLYPRYWDQGIIGLGKEDEGKDKRLETGVDKTTGVRFTR